MAESEEVPCCSNPKRRKVNKSEWIRTLKLKQERKNRSHKLDSDCLDEDLNFKCKCPLISCVDKIGGPEQVRLLRQKFDGLLLSALDDHQSYQYSHYIQNLFLVQFVHFEGETPKGRPTYKYFLWDYDYSNIPVCSAALTFVFGIGKYRLATLKDPETGHVRAVLSEQGKAPSANKTPEDTVDCVRRHIASFPARDSHYTLHKSKRKYLDSSLNTAKMWRMYQESHPNKKVSYFIYLNIFTTHFNIKFGFPRTDICESCDKFQVQIKAPEISPTEKEALENKRKDHLQNAEMFHTKMREVKELSKKDKKHHVICFDYEKNLPLPLTNVQSEYYKRQLWLHNFCVHNVGAGTATMFLYAEHYARKTPNEVISSVDYYLRNCVPEEAEILHVFCDNCPGQNKNRSVLFYFHLLTKVQRWKAVFLYFPVPGHSYMPCDQDFALIEKERRKKQRVIAPSEWVDVVRNARKNNKFRLVFVQYPLTDDMKQDHTPVCSVLDFKSVFEPLIVNKIDGGLLSMRGFKFENELVFGRVSLCDENYYNIDISRKMFQAKKVLEMPKLAYDTFVPVNDLKVKDVMSLLSQVCEVEKIPFYSYIVGDKNVPEFEEEEL